MVLAATTSIALIASLAAALFAESLLHGRLSLVGSTVGLQIVQNDGIAFGIDLPIWILTPLITVAMLLLLRLAWQQRTHTPSAVGFGLVIGGGFANIADRIDDGFVTDFIQIGWWPVFNIADSCITVGVGMLLLLHSPLWTRDTASKASDLSKGKSH